MAEEAHEFPFPDTTSIPEPGTAEQEETDAAYTDALLRASLMVATANSISGGSQGDGCATDEDDEPAERAAEPVPKQECGTPYVATTIADDLFLPSEPKRAHKKKSHAHDAAAPDNAAATSSKKEKKKKEREREQEPQAAAPKEAEADADGARSIRAAFLRDLEERFPRAEDVRATADDLAQVPVDKNGRMVFTNAKHVMACRVCLLSRQGPAKCMESEQKHKAASSSSSSKATPEHGLLKNNDDLREAIRTFLNARRRELSTPARSDDTGSTCGTAPPSKKARASRDQPASSSSSSFTLPIANTEAEAIAFLEAFSTGVTGWLHTTLGLIGNETMRRMAKKSLLSDLASV